MLHIVWFFCLVSLRTLWFQFFAQNYLFLALWWIIYPLFFLNLIIFLFYYILRLHFDWILNFDMIILHIFFLILQCEVLSWNLSSRRGVEIRKKLCICWKRLSEIIWGWAEPNWVVVRNELSKLNDVLHIQLLLTNKKNSAT